MASGPFPDPPWDRAEEAYQARRAQIAAISGTRAAGPPPTVEYTEQEDLLWRRVCGQLSALHRQVAAREYLEAAGELAVPQDHVPQLRDVSERLTARSGFAFGAASELVPFRAFCSGLAGRRFLSTQYLRNPASPFYSPDPDMLHDVIGHGNALADKRFARLYELAGKAASRMRTEEGLQAVASVFWFTLECGLLREDGEPKAYGATIVSSVGEASHYRDAHILPLDLTAMVTAEYDISTYQPALFEARSLGHLEDVVGAFWETCDDETVSHLIGAPGR
ncbi:phenylalanine 4-monooxygenase [Streptomyces flaveolus]|uniref:phenylalanine 4-monooxygenase n=1 Tax=Streptomyces flaveolus TaxID=67297 RepID=UPI00340851C7